MQVLVDIGNTRIKWALYDGKRLAQHGSAVHRGAVDAAVQTFARALPRELTRVVVANVAGDALDRAIRAVVGSRAVDFIATTAERFGVRCAYDEPQRLGVDRWVAVLAAHRLAAGTACVIQAGTAVTFDAVAADGAHLGGLILPGARLLASALDRNTSHIGATPVPAGVPKGLALLGRDTATAVGHGAMLAISSALDRGVRAVAAATGTAPRVYLAGGDAAELGPWLETKVEARADLVLEGLALFAAEHASQAKKGR